MFLKKRNEEVQESEANVLCDLDLREIYIVGNIDGSTFQSTVIALRNLEASKGPITIILNTPGGDVSAGMGMYDAIRMCKNKVTCICMGQCMSMGLLILSACDDRLSSQECQFMAHDAQVALNQAPLSTINRYIADAQYSKQRYVTLLAEKSHLTVKEVEALCSIENFMSAEQAMGYGFLDGIILPAKKKGKKK